MGGRALPGWSGAAAEVMAPGITLSSASVPATICSIPICMRREAHYVATLMWEEGAGERWGGRGRDEGNGALEARRTAERFRRRFLGSACSDRAEGSGGAKGGDGRPGKDWRGPVFDNSSVHGGSARSIPENKRGHAKKGRNHGSIQPDGQGRLRSVWSPALTSIFTHQAQDPIVLSTTAHQQRVWRKMESMEINK